MEGDANMGLFSNLFKKDKGRIEISEDVRQNSIEIKKEEQIIINPKKEITFRVAGITMEDRQKRIKDAVKEEREFAELYEGWSNKEILEMYSEGERVYELNINGYSEIELIPEPGNKFDPNAIKVIHEDIGHVGYVPATYCKKVKKAIEEGYELEWKLLGGKYKYIEFDDDKCDDVVKTTTDTYGIEITLTEP